MADINLGVGGANSASDAYEIANSLKFEADNTEYLSHSSSSGSGTKVTYSFWCKRTELDSSSYMQVSGISTSSETVRFMFYQDSVRLDAGNSSTGKILITDRKFRDTSAWYHFFVVIDTTLATEGDRHQLWVNGVRETSFSTEQYPTQNFSVATDQSNATWRYGAYDSTYYKFSGYLAECYRLDGIAASCTDFGEFDTNGIWIPKEYTGSFGSNGHYLDFEDSSSLGADDSGNGNNFTLNNIAAADQATDTPTNNFCILNPNFIAYYYKAPTDGGTYMPMNGINQYGAYAGTFGLTKGKWYYETYVDMRDSTYGLTVLVGIHTLEGNYHATNFMVDSTNQNSTAAYYLHGGHYYSWDSGARVVDSTLGGVGSAQVGQFIGIALNLDDNQISFYINGSAVTNGTNLALNDAGDDIAAGSFAIPSFSCYTNNHTVNFGGYTRATISSAQSDENGYGTFEHQPPSGYYAICSKNLAEYG
jgi:hypothetical protein